MLSGIINGISYRRILDSLSKYLSPLKSRADYYENETGTKVSLQNLKNCQDPPSTENLLEKASIVTTPTAYENGQLLSVKPNVNENLMPRSEEFSLFGGNVSSVIDNFGLAPNGTQTAAKITYSSQYQGISQSLGFTSGTYTLSCYIKNIDGNSELYFRGVSNALIYAKAITITNEWARYEATFTHDGTYDIEWQLQDRNSSGFGSCLIWGAQIVKGSKVGTYTKTEGTPIPRADFDFSRGSSATRLNSQGLIEDVQIIGGDLVQNGDFSQEGSEVFTNGDFSTDSDWFKGGSATISGGYLNLTASGDFAQQSITNPSHYVVRINVSSVTTSGDLRIRSNNFAETFTFSVTSAQVYTFYSPISADGFVIQSNGFIGSIGSVSVKEVGQNWIVGTNVNISNGKANWVNTANNVGLNQSGVITNGKNYKVTFTVSNYTSGSFRIRFPFTSDRIQANGTYTFNGVASGTDLYLQGETLTDPNVNFSIDNVSVKEIIEDTDLPRIDYTNGVGSILLEPESTNLSTTSEQWQQWGSNSVTSPTPNNNVAIAPDGTQTAWQFDINSNTDRLQKNRTITVGNDYSFSFFIKTSTGEFTSFQNLGPYPSAAENLRFNGTTKRMERWSGTIQTDWKVESYANDWYRVSRSWQNVADNLFLYISYPYYNGVLTRAYIWGAQLEEKSFPTSYIPTVGSSVTRLKESLTNSGNADLFGTEGVLYAEFKCINNLSSSFNRVINLNDGSSGDDNSVKLLRSNSVSDRFFWQIEISNTIEVSQTITLSDSTEFNKVAISYKSGDTKFFVNGVSVATKTETFTIPALNQLDLSSSTGFNNFEGNVKCIAVFKEALTDEELTCLTSYTIEDALHSIDSRAAQKSFNFFKFSDFKTRLKKLF